MFLLSYIAAPPTIGFAAYAAVATRPSAPIESAARVFRFMGSSCESSVPLRTRIQKEVRAAYDCGFEYIFSDLRNFPGWGAGGTPSHTLCRHWEGAWTTRSDAVPEGRRRGRRVATGGTHVPR